MTFTDEEIQLIENRYGDVDLYLKFWQRTGCDCALKETAQHISDHYFTD